jgi:hypothetical protein
MVTIFFLFEVPVVYSNNGYIKDFRSNYEKSFSKANPVLKNGALALAG